MRKIIHVDCDCFYAAVEMRDRPELRDLPIAIGGSPSERGVISTCNYPARKFGIHSAMPTSRALRLCPDLVLLPHSFERYREASRQVQRIFADYTDLIEPLSLDEAYLDVSAQPHCKGSATLMAREIRARIEKEVGITASAGIAPNKLLAKIASDWRKPNGQFVITPEEVAAFMPALPVAKLWGIGKVTASRLAGHGLNTCADVQAMARTELVSQFGRLGETLYWQSRGIDHRPVGEHRERKSLSVEHTYAQDLPDLAACMARLPELIADLQRRQQRSRHPIHKAFVKIRFHDFSQTTMECPANQAGTALYAELIRQAWQRKASPVRLLGVGVRFAAQPAAMQTLSLI